jgi:hypothetical protein
VAAGVLAGGPGTACGAGGQDSCLGQTRVQTRVWLEVEDAPDRRALSVSEHEKGRRDVPGGLVGPREQLGWLGRAGRRKKRKRPAGLGHAGREGEREKEKERVAGPKEKKREKKKCI